MALKKIMEIEGEAFINTPSGRYNLGHEKASFSAYCKIININGDKNTGKVIVECKGEKYKVQKEYVVEFLVDDNAPNFIKQAYETLKKLPEWADATDC
jgi:hypothetical protein